MEKTSVERRKRRSSNCAEALALLLESTREQARLASLVLSDRTGILVAGAGPAHECDELAAWAPVLLSARESAPQGLFGVRVRGLDAYLCAAGAGGSPLSLLSEAAEGCARILGVRRVETNAGARVE
jgi:hypothetical protein